MEVCHQKQLVGHMCHVPRPFHGSFCLHNTQHTKPQKKLAYIPQASAATCTLSHLFLQLSWARVLRLLRFESSTFAGLPSLLMPAESVSRGTCFRDSIGSSPSLACSTTSSSASAPYQTQQVALWVAQQNNSAIAASRQLQRPICVIIIHHAVGQPVHICPRPSLHCRVSPTGPITHPTAPHALLSLLAQLQHQLGSPAAVDKVTFHCLLQAQVGQVPHTSKHHDYACMLADTDTDTHTAGLPTCT